MCCLGVLPGKSASFCTALLWLSHQERQREAKQDLAFPQLPNGTRLFRTFTYLSISYNNPINTYSDTR